MNIRVMDRLIRKLNSGPNRFGSKNLLMNLGKDTEIALLSARADVEFKKLMTTTVLRRFHALLKNTNFPSGIRMVPNGFFLYGGQVIHAIYERSKSKVKIDPRIAHAMEMTPSSDYDGQLLLEFVNDTYGDVDLKYKSISKRKDLKKFLERIMKKAVSPFKKYFKVEVSSRTPITMDITLSNPKTGFKLVEIHSSNAHSTMSKRYFEKTTCCVTKIRGFGLPVLNVKSLLYDQLFALDSMLTGNSHRVPMRKAKCQQRFVRMMFLYELLKKTSKKTPNDVRVMANEIAMRMDKKKYQKYFKECSVLVH